MWVFILISLLCSGSTLSAKIQTPQKKSVFIFPKDETPLNKNAPIRIVGGQEANAHQFPYQVGLYVTYAMNQAFCGGSLISQNYVLTAAHCAEGAVSMQVILGAHNISDTSESSRQTQTSATFIVHPSWDSSTLTNDVALVKLTTPAELNSYVQIIQLASGSNSYANNQGIATGWGKTIDSQSSVTDILRYETNTIMNNEQCKATDSDYASVIKDTHLCQSGEGIRGICKGDSGGPLVTNGVQVGITSFSYKSCEAGKPSVFTRITSFSDWITNNSDVTFL
ncbi:brachyurin-like [Anthonomus grandis grandis]|uniref:brachyurin-like n=1 Tax=Anthonomus grandis grandis TaxID=2921223 RepID=UPI0021668F9F|nr:brachyurin-like [Anthonomus grandis grandis]